MERRAFVRLSAYTALVLSMPLLDGCSRPEDNPLALPLFFSHIADVKTINEAGLAYRKMAQSEDDKTKLAQLLDENLFQDSNSSDKEAVRTALEAKVRYDFQTNKTVTVSGWVLSITEARQCALFSILNS